MQHIRWEQGQLAQALATADCWPRCAMCRQNHISTGVCAQLHSEATHLLSMHSLAAADCPTTSTLACLQEKLFHKIEDDYGLDPHGIEVGAAYTLVALS